MKCTNIWIGIFLLCILLTQMLINCNKDLKNFHPNKDSKIHKVVGNNVLGKKVFHEEEAKLYIKFAKLAHCSKKPLTINCKKCKIPEIEQFQLFYFQQIEIKNFFVKFLIYYDDINSTIVVSFGGPLINLGNYEHFSKIYSKGLVNIKIGDKVIGVEVEYWKLFKKLRKKLITKLKKILNSVIRHNYRVVFTGYSVGGAIATLAAYYIIQSKIVKAYNHPIIYLYGPLRIGDNLFIQEVNKVVDLWRIYKENDFIVKMPNCGYSTDLNLWKCSKKNIFVNYFPKRPLQFHIQFPNKKEKIKEFNNSKIKINKSVSMPDNLKKNKQIDKNTKNIFFTKNNSTQNLKKEQPIKIKMKAHLAQNSFAYKFYTSDLGTQVYYDGEMNKYRLCGYSKSVSECEKIINVPTNFQFEGTYSYFRLDFTECKKFN